MSGGSLDYIYGRIEDAVGSITGRSRRPLHQAFTKHLQVVADALYKLEWEFSGATGKGDADAAIRAVLSPGAEADAALEALREAVQVAQKVLSQEKAK